MGVAECSCWATSTPYFESTLTPSTSCVHVVVTPLMIDGDTDRTQRCMHHTPRSMASPETSGRVTERGREGGEPFAALTLLTPCADGRVADMR